jgi:FolB domain-containing protein
MIVKIKNLKLKTILGVYDWEKTFDREIVINVEMETDFVNAAQSDNLNDAIDYDIITSKIKNLITKKRFKLIEKMTQEVLEVILEDDRIKKCKVEIDKVGVVEGVESFSVTIEKTKPNGY